MSGRPSIIDAYAHVGMPRFQSVEDYQAEMARAGIGRAVLCSFDSSPDLLAIHAAISRAPETYRGLGVPLGRDRAEMEAAVHAQLAAGLSGLRLTDEDVVERPWLLDALAAADRIAIVCGQPSSERTARALLANFERNPDAVVIGGHFAGVGDPKLLAGGPAAELFAHPRFHVVFSRHGGFAGAAVLAWAEAVVAKTGWQRILWGSESPLIYWRTETMADAIGWVDRLSPTEEERTAFHGGNTDRLYFSRPVTVAPLDLPFDPFSRARSFPATILANGLPMDQAIAGRLVHAWLAEGGKGNLGAFMERLLDRSLPPSEGV
ncbi:MAG: amidohydrolase family protein [Rhizobiaceae bacterium]|nr:amidohydrolase family protein [Rhizobiaceae bacterium]